jgi:hypothetical protein
VRGVLETNVNAGPINFERESNPYTTLAIKFQPYIGGIAPYISYGKTFTSGQHTVYDRNPDGMSLNNDEPPKYIRIPTGSSINTGVEINIGKSLRLNMEFGQTKFPEKKFTLPIDLHPDARFYGFTERQFDAPFSDELTVKHRNIGLTFTL